MWDADSEQDSLKSPSLKDNPKISYKNELVISCYGLNISPLQNTYWNLIANVMILEGGAF